MTTESIDNYENDSWGLELFEGDVARRSLRWNAWRALSPQRRRLVRKITLDQWILRNRIASIVGIVVCVSIAAFLTALVVSQPSLKMILMVAFVDIVLLGLIPGSLIATLRSKACEVIHRLWPDTCPACGYQRGDVPRGAPCAECGDVLPPQEHEERHILRRAGAQHQLRARDMTTNRWTVSIFTTLTASQRKRAIAEHLRQDVARRSRTRISLGTSAAFFVFLCIAGWLIARGVLAVTDSDLPPFPIGVAFACIPTSLWWLHMRTDGYIGLLRGESLRRFVRAINTTLDHSCPVCDRERNNLSRCPTCGCPPIPEYQPTHQPIPNP